MDKVYLCYSQFPYEGPEPLAIVSSEEKANKWLEEHTQNCVHAGRKYNPYSYMEFTLDAV